MTEDRFRAFQAFFKTLSAIGAVVVFFFGIHRWHAEQAALIDSRIAAEQTARDREFRRELWMRQLNTLSDIADTASRIAAFVDIEDGTEFRAAARRYEQLYWANVVFVEDPGLVEAMDALRQELRLFDEGLQPLSGLNRYDLVKQRSHAVALACRRSVLNGRKRFLGSGEFFESSDRKVPSK